MDSSTTSTITYNGMKLTHPYTVGFHLQETPQMGRAQRQGLKVDQSVGGVPSSSCNIVKTIIKANTTNIEAKEIHKKRTKPSLTCFYSSSSSSSLKPQLKNKNNKSVILINHQNKESSLRNFKISRPNSDGLILES